MTVFILSSLFMLYLFFAVIIFFKAVIIRNNLQRNPLAMFLTKTFGGLFYWLDVCTNYVCFAPIVLHWPNVETRTITDHANLLIGEYLANEDPDASWLEEWRFDCALFVCHHLNNIDDNHCNSLKP